MEQEKVTEPSKAKNKKTYRVLLIDLNIAKLKAIQVVQPNYVKDLVLVIAQKTKTAIELHGTEEFDKILLGVPHGKDVDSMAPELQELAKTFPNTEIKLRNFGTLVTEKDLKDFFRQFPMSASETNRLFRFDDFR